MEPPAPKHQRLETDREDLLGEATALVERIEFAAPAAPSGTASEASSAHLVVGFRKDGCASFYFDGDPVYHFNSRGQLRRAFVDDRLLKAQRGGLVSMRRQRTGGAVNLVSHVMENAEREAILAALAERLRLLREQLAAGELAIIGQVPGDADVVGRVRRWLDEHDAITIAATPHAR